MTIKLNSGNFQKEAINSDIPALVDFWGSWCPPCKMMEPVIDQLSVELAGKVKVAKLNVDQNRDVAANMNIMGAPTFILFVNGEEQFREVGARSKQQLIDKLKEHGVP